MELFNLGHFPEGLTYSYLEIASLDEGTTEKISRRPELRPFFIGMVKDHTKGLARHFYSKMANGGSEIWGTAPAMARLMA